MMSTAHQLGATNEGQVWEHSSSVSASTTTPRVAASNVAPSAKTQTMNWRAVVHRVSDGVAVVVGIFYAIATIIACVTLIEAWMVVSLVLFAITFVACVIYIATSPPSFWYGFAKFSPEALLVDGYINKDDYMTLKLADNETKQKAEETKQKAEETKQKAEETKQLKIKETEATKRKQEEEATKRKQEDTKQLALQYQMMLLQQQQQNAAEHIVVHIDNPQDGHEQLL